MKLEINYKKKTKKFLNMWSLNNMLLNNQLVKEEIKREIKKYLETSKNVNTIYQNLCKSTSKREVCNNTYIKKKDLK